MSTPAIDPPAAEAIPSGRNGHANDPVAVPGGVPAPAGGQPRVWWMTKRGFDIAFSIVSLIALAPFLLIIALAIRIDSRGPVLFRQVRVGRDLEPFTMLKFRTMYQDVSPEMHRRYIACLAEESAADEGDGLKKLVDDPRVTRVGGVLRKLSLDELPQFFNVLAGSMSVIGPRPALEYELEHYQPQDYLRFTVRPGLSGLWQVSGRNELGFREMLQLDAEYARECGLGLDARVLVKTPLALFRGAA